MEKKRHNEKFKIKIKIQEKTAEQKKTFMTR